ncbi:MAG: dihydroorotate dehydrogenase electron transfer subunit [Lentisphaerae bacterium]|nr:dihydroorotate dehydrogenase electron transfer subunit [Lentisphaerota bacterium]
MTGSPQAGAVRGRRDDLLRDVVVRAAAGILAPGIRLPGYRSARLTAGRRDRTLCGAMEIEQASILRHQPCGGAYRELVLNAPAIAASVRPGQFLHLRIPRFEQAVLRRPFSVFRAEGEHISILYKTVGAGTMALTGVREGEVVNVMGPLGNGFPSSSPGSLPVLVAGGYGVAPLYLLARRMDMAGIIFIGAATSDDVLCVEDFAAFGWQIEIATEDGSRGARGLVTGPLDAWLASRRCPEQPEIFACGPDGMLRAVGERAIKAGHRAWLSMDRHMGCGVGACLGCVQRLKKADGSAYWGRVCRDGPVFDASQIVWNNG